MAYEFNCDRRQCMNCGVCMDVCPPQSLDMTRPTVGAEGSAGGNPSMPWMMAFPVQVAKCSGCMICAVECPVGIITIKEVAGEVTLAQRQGPTFQEPVDGGGWVPMSALTRESLKRVKPDPWGSLFKWKPRVPRREKAARP